ncbi:hypothetical protein MPSEU_000295300 [Mayamaea pseudoterrestris]|nr:hypothetical protein MPSEU_000295300 [Mayamaea pseudoterrestris]
MTEPQQAAPIDSKMQPEETSATSTITKSKTSMTNIADARYTCDMEKLQKLRTAVPWAKDPKFFKTVAISPSAIMKIMMHCASGVEKGIAKGGNPTEVMGLLLGRPDPDTPSTFVVTDAFALPIEGFETRVIADDDTVTNHMIALGESLERTRRERFMGWYHSHPFDLGEHSHCFMSQTDISTHLQWQRAEDPHGNPFVAIVVDPLRTAHLGTPELKAFRAYPPEYMSPTANECPDGSVETSEQVRLEHWGSCWNRYYELNIEYYMSQTSRKIMEQLTQNYLWIRKLTQPADNTSKLVACAKQFKTAANASNTPTGGTTSRSTANRASTMASLLEGGGSRGGGRTRGKSEASLLAGPNTPRSKEWNKAVGMLDDLASEQVCENSLHATKEHLFS